MLYRTERGYKGIMGFSVFIDWIEEFKKNYDKWENLGRAILNEKCNHHSKDSGENNLISYQGYCEKCDVYEDSCEPMMNYGYPLYFNYIEEEHKERILEVVKNTNCTIMYNNETDTSYLVLCGCGMDLSQDIALGFLIMEKWIPEDLIGQVCKQKGFSISLKNFDRLKEAIIEQAKHYSEKHKLLAKEWKEIETKPKLKV